MTATGVSWRDAWHEALYSPAGYYRRDQANPLGFATSMHGVPQAPAVMARALVALAARHGLDTLIDIGAHRGELAHALAQVGSQLRYVGADITTGPSRDAGIDDWWQAPGGAALPEQMQGLAGALVVAHEWLDVVPAVVASRGSGGVWREVLVDIDTGNPMLGSEVADDDRAWLEQWVGPEVEVAEVGRSRDEALRAVMDRVEHGVVLAIDYGHDRRTRPRHGSLRGYSGGRQVDPVPDGSMDLTADVAIDSLVAAAAPDRVWAQEQRSALSDLLGPARTPDRSLAAADPAAYLTALAEAGARRSLGAPEAFGSFWWVCVDRTRPDHTH